MLDEHDKKSMLSAMLTRVGPFFVEVELATRPARSTGDDCACIWPAGVSRMRRDRHAQGYGRIGDAGATGLPELRTSLRGQHSGPAVPANGRINLLHYMGDEGSILCKLQFGPDLTNEAFVSITHLRLDAPEPPLNCCSAATRCEKLGAVIDEIDRQRVTRSTDLPDAA